MSTLKNIKRASLQMCKSLGGYRLLQDSPWRRRRLLILCYHGVSIEDEHEWNAELYMHPAALGARFEILKRGGYNVLPLDEGLRRMYAGDLPERSVSITFDDGMYDFYKQAYPLLKAYGFPATNYVSTYYCDYNKPIFGLICSYMLWRARGKRIDARSLTDSELMLDSTTPEDRGRAVTALTDFADRQQLSGAEKNDLAERLAALLGIDYEALLAKRILHLMNGEEVARLSAEGIDMQLHTHRHRTPLDTELFHKEIRDNRARIEEMTGTRAVHFCYPSGLYRPEFLPWLGEANVVSATTCDPDIASPESNALTLPRLVDHSSLTPIEFEGWLTGAASFLPRQKSYADG